MSFPNSYVEALTPQYDGVKRWGLWEVVRFRLDHKSWTFMIGLVPLREEREISLSRSVMEERPYEDIS